MFYGNNNYKSVGLWIRQATLPTLSGLEIRNNNYGIFWPTSSTCQDLDNNSSLIFSQNTYGDKKCGQADPW
ncbi:MAG: hypothetical protein Q8N16_00040 [bacterium]|nr:hypothetical protein [bacterium]